MARSKWDDLHCKIVRLLHDAHRQGCGTLTARQIAGHLGLTREMANEVLLDAAAKGKIHRSPPSKRGNPFRYSLKSQSSTLA